MTTASTRLRGVRLMGESTPTRRGPRPGRGRARGRGVGETRGCGRPAPTDAAALTFLSMGRRPSFCAEFKVVEGGEADV